MIDSDLREKISESKKHIPDDISKMVVETLEQLPEKDNKIVKIERKHKRNRIIKTVAAAVLAIMLILPNTYQEIAYAMGNIPVVGSFFKIVTIRKYENISENEELEMKRPLIQGDIKGSAYEDVNNDVEKYINKILDEFNKKTGNWDRDGHLSMNIDYDVITNNSKWFTLRIEVTEIAASSNVYYKYYHLNKETDSIVQWNDLFVDNYKASKVIKEQIIKQIKEDDENVYWLDILKNDIRLENEEEGWNYYFTNEGEIVIVFDKYVIGPGQAGCPSFIIPLTTYKEYISNIYPEQF